MQKTIDRIKAVEHLEQVFKIFKGKVNVGQNRKAVDFECELNDVNAFLESNEERYSEFFFTQYLAWHLQFAIHAVGEQKFLSIYLFPKNYYPFAGKWSLSVTIEVSLLDQTGRGNRTAKDTFEFGNGYHGSGWSDFISIDFLRTGGFIKNNKIQVRLHLEVGELRSNLSV